MTEQEKARGRRFIVSVLVAMFVAIIGTAAWLKLNEPMGPIVIEFGDRYHVRWGNRFHPFVYEQNIDTGAEKVILDGLTWPNPHGRQVQGWGHLDSYPAEAFRRFVEGRMFLDTHLHQERVRKARIGGLYRF